MTRGRFVTFEGGEGAGKSTQVRLLIEALGRAGIDALATREPGGAPGAEQIRRLLVEGDVGRWDPMTEALLHFAARRDHMARTVWPALDAGRWVVSDRFADSTMAYQGHGQALDRSVIEGLYRLVLGDFAPDLTVILDLPVEVGLGRAAARNGSGVEDRYERMGLDFHRRLRQAFLDIAAREPTRCVVIPADGTPAAIHAAILDALRLHLDIPVA
ncbi:MAG: dTMP kinase [Alphaproteobacteria bacterium]